MKKLSALLVLAVLLFSIFTPPSFACGGSKSGGATTAAEDSEE